MRNMKVNFEKKQLGQSTCRSPVTTLCRFHRGMMEIFALLCAVCFSRLFTRDAHLLNVYKKHVNAC